MLLQCTLFYQSWINKTLHVCEFQREIADNPEEFRKFKRMMLTTCDASGDGSLQRDEIALWLGVDSY